MNEYKYMDIMQWNITQGTIYRHIHDTNKNDHIIIIYLTISYISYGDYVDRQLNSYLNYTLVYH